MKRRLFALVLALCVFAGAFVGAPQARAAGSAAYVVANTLEIYKSASTSAKRLGIASYGESISFLASGADGWAKVKCAGKTGFCRLDGLSNSNPNTMNVSARVNADKAPLYKRPDESAAVWKKLKKGAVFTAVAMTRDNAWVRLKNGKKFGYIQARYLVTADATPEAEPTPGPGAAPTALPGGKVYAVATELPVYAKASASAKSKGSLYYGQDATCVAVQGNWAKIRNSAGKTGFCQTAGLSASNPNKLDRQVWVNADSAPAYKKPVAGAAVWKKLRRGARFTAVAITPDGSWTRLQIDGKFAYTPSKFLTAEELSPTPSPSPAPMPTSSAAPLGGKVFVSANAATVHAGASTSSKVLDTVPYGDSVELVGAPEGGWVAVRTPSKAKGYCQTDSLTAQDPNTYARTVYVNTDDAPVYRLPLSSAPVWTKLKRNASFTAVAITPDGEWVRLKNGKNFAYIRSEHVSASKQAPAKDAYVIDAELPVYAETSEKSKLLGHLYLGQSVELIGAADGWSKVRNASGTSGYCLSGGLSDKDPNTLNKPLYAREKSVKLYAEPSKKAKVVRSVAQNTSLMVVCVSSDELWARVALDSGFAYVQTDSLSDKKIEDGSLIEDIQPTTVYVLPTTLSIYAQPKAGAKSLGGMSFGESLTCTGKSSAWARVENSAGTVGYCDVNSVTAKDPNTYSVALYAQVKGAKVYKSPKTSAKVLAQLSVNELVTGIARSEDLAWYRVKNGDACGYVEAAYFATSQIKDDSQSGAIADIINLAKSFLGVPYVYGGQSPKGFDCSGFVYYVFKNAAKITLKRTAYTQGYDDKYEKITRKADLKAGDVLFFNTVVDDDDQCDHAGIYLGGNQFIHASSGGGKVIISSLGTSESSYYFRTYSWARRIIR